MKRFATMAAILAALVLAVAPSFAQVSQSQGLTWTVSPVTMRNTNQPTGSVVAVTDWTTVTKSGATSIGTTPFADSVTYSRGSSAGNYVADTTTAFVPSTWPRLLPVATAAGDTIGGKFMTVYVRLEPGTQTITTVFDSVYVGFQGSNDGVNWFNINGTPTRLFVTDGAPANGNLTALVGAERATAENAAYIPFRCRSVSSTAGSNVPNLDLCEFPGYVRIILLGDYAGLYRVEVGHWQ